MTQKTNEGEILEIGKDKVVPVNLSEVMSTSYIDYGNIIPLLKESIQAWTPEAMAEQVGEVVTVGDGIATVAGLPHATFGEILLFADGVRGMVQDIRRDTIGCVLFSSDESVTQGSSVKRTGKTAGTPVGEGFLGRVVYSLGSPVDGLGEITASGYMPV